MDPSWSFLLIPFRIVFFFDASTLWKWTSRDIISARTLVRRKVLLDSTYLTRSGLRITMSRHARHHVFKVKQLLFAHVLNHLFHYSLEEGKEPENTVWKFNPVIKIHNANPPVAQLHLFYHQKIWVVTCNFIRETAGRGSSVHAQESQRSHPLWLCAALHVSNEEDTKTSLKDRSQEESSSEATEISRSISVLS